jgi:ketosteroid isomerase-like protein
MTRPLTPHAARQAGATATRPRIEVRPTAPRPRSRRSGLAPTIARWPLEVDGGFETRWCSDTATNVVRQSLADYRSGRADRASRVWHDDITWSVPGPAPVGGERIGPDGVFAYHDLLERLSDGTFRQRLLALEGCRGSIVTAYLRTTASRAGRRLEVPTLAVFELAGGRVRRVTELPGDRAAWEGFCAD